MIKKFEQFIGEMLSNDTHILKNKLIYSNILGDEGGICKTWDDVLKLFAHTKYNVPCIVHSEDNWSWHKANSILDVIKRDVEGSDEITITIDNGIIYIDGVFRNTKFPEYSLSIYVLNAKGISATVGNGGTVSTFRELTDDRFVLKIGYDIIK